MQDLRAGDKVVIYKPRVPENGAVFWDTESMNSYIGRAAYVRRVAPITGFNIKNDYFTIDIDNECHFWHYSWLRKIDPDRGSGRTTRMLLAAFQALIEPEKKRIYVVCGQLAYAKSVVISLLEALKIEYSYSHSCFRLTAGSNRNEMYFRKNFDNINTEMIGRRDDLMIFHDHEIVFTLARHQELYNSGIITNLGVNIIEK